MNNNRDRRQIVLLCALGTIPVTWLALIAAPVKNEGLPGIVREIYRVMVEGEYTVTWSQDSLTTVLLFLLLYGAVIGAVLSTRHNYRRLEEHGSAKWGDKWLINQRYADREANVPKENFAPKTLTKQEIGVKTESSHRELPIPDIVFEAIIKERYEYEKNRSRRINDKNNPFYDGNIIADGVPEIEMFMKEVLPDLEKREQFKRELLQIVPDVRQFLPDMS